MKTWVGAGRSRQASGARAGDELQVPGPQPPAVLLQQLQGILPLLDGVHPALRAWRAISMATEPVPAPTSQQRASAVSRSLERATARTSLMVMGTTAPSPPRWKVSSGEAWVTTGAFATGSR